MYLEDFLIEIKSTLEALNILSNSLNQIICENYTDFKSNKKEEFSEAKGLIHAILLELKYVNNLKNKYQKIVDNSYRNKVN